ncbi:hypothetical protein BDW74DRAFT_179291 [Aspergillus multicolor]|uniref:uncharacterized protein n=1 Tax=Aspergillus multicolor TaxID=41759 RepID=UPI003CCCB9FA
MGKRNLYSQIWLPFLLELLSITIFVLTAWIAQTTLQLTPRTSILGYTINASSILTLLSITNGLQSILTSTILALIGRDKGFSSIGVLGLSPTTGFFGVLRIFFSRCSRFLDRLWPLLRLILATLLWLSGIILFADTSVGIAYDPVYSYAVTAGNGQFNGSTVRPYIDLLSGKDQGYQYTIVPYWMQAVVNNLVTTPMHSAAGQPVRVAACAENECDSYLLPGGLIGATPWPPTNYSSAPVIQMTAAPTVQLNFSSGLNGHIFFEDDCRLFGANNTYVGIRFCLSTSQAFNGSFAAGLYVCPEGAYDGTCHLGNNTFQPNITTTFSTFSRKTTFVAARSNMSILSVTSSSTFIQQSMLDIDSFRFALTWLLDFNASGIPAPSSIAEQFWSSQEQLKSVYWSPVITQTFHSLLAFPFWFFNANNLGNVENHGRDISPSLPAEFYTTASVANQHYRIVISNSMFAIFVALHATLHVAIWTLFVWLCFLKRPSLPTITSFPLFDFAFKTTYTRNAPTQTDKKQGRIYHLAPQAVPADEIEMATDGEALAALKPCTHFLRRGGDTSVSPGPRPSPDPAQTRQPERPRGAQSMQQTSLSSVSALLPA